MYEQNAAGGDALGACGAEVGRLEGFEQGSAGDAGDCGAGGASKRDSGEDQRGKGMPAAYGKPAKVKREEQHEQRSGDKSGHGNECEGEKRGKRIGSGAMAYGGEAAQKDAAEGGQ